MVNTSERGDHSIVSALASYASPFACRLWLAPLTRGGHLAFRRLCVELGAEVTVSEMAVVRNLLKGKNAEFALLKSHASETCFGVQLADRSEDSLAEGARLAESRGARFLDLNCGCPTADVTGRGMGASLMRKPTRLARLVATMVRTVAIPVTVKLRTGWSGQRPNVSEVARACEEAGASALTVHGRSREQRYQQAADWELIGRVAAERTIPVVGNGDILTHYEARERLARSGVSSLMLARGALIKPWLFREIREGRGWEPTAEERLALLLRFTTLLREHFGGDARGGRRILGFLPWHLGFFCRYRPLPEAEYGALAREHPLIQRRQELGEGLDPLEGLLRDPRPETHARLAEALLDAADPADARERALLLASDVGPASASGEWPMATREVTG
jgi:tRNA-dihydrouridine synthase 3